MPLKIEEMWKIEKSQDRKNVIFPYYFAIIGFILVKEATCYILYIEEHCYVKKLLVSKLYGGQEGLFYEKITYPVVG